MTNTTGTSAEHSLRILLANEREAVELIAREDPDLAFVVLDGNDEHGLALISETVSFASGPVLVTVREAESPSTIARAADMGIAGYVDSWEPADVQAAIDVALRHHREQE